MVELIFIKVFNLLVVVFLTELFVTPLVQNGVPSRRKTNLSYTFNEKIGFFSSYFRGGDGTTSIL